MNRVEDLLTYKRWKTVIFISLVFFYLTLSYGLMSGNWTNHQEYIPLLICFGLLFFNHYELNKRNPFLYYSIPLIMTGLIIYANQQAVTDNYKIIILVVTASIIFEYPASFSFIFLWIPLIAYLGFSTVILRNETDIISLDFLLGFLMKNMITYSLVALSVFLVQRQLLLNEKLKQLMKENKENRIRLQEMKIAEERSRIAREIHDTLGTTLTGAIIQLEAAKKYIHIDQDKALKSIEKTQDITRTGFSEVKRAIKALRPIDLTQMTLKEAIIQLKDRIESTFGFRIEMNMDLPDEIEEKIKNEVYSIVQELVTNSKKHSGSDSLNLTLSAKKNNLIIYSHDNGRGFGSLTEGYGLRGIRERVEELQGQVKYSTHEVEGFQTLITLPLERKEA